MFKQIGDFFRYRLFYYLHGNRFSVEQKRVFKKYFLAFGGSKIDSFTIVDLPVIIDIIRVINDVIGEKYGNSRS